MKDLNTARVLFYIMSGSFLLSAAILGAVRLSGKAVVPAYVLAGWGGLGVIGAAVTPLLSADRRWVAVVLAVALGPWMAYSLAQDAKLKNYVMTATDVGGLFAIGLGVWLSYKSA